MESKCFLGNQIRKNEMKLSLIICTYKRAKALQSLLISICNQTLYPNEILIIDGSPDNQTQEMLSVNNYENLVYYLVEEKDRGLTKQRNYGVSNISEDSDIVCFLDDDTILKNNYFEEIIKTYKIFPNALGVGGYIINESEWKFVGKDYKAQLNEFYFDEWLKKDGLRFVWRKKIRLDSNVPPGYLPEFSHGRSISFLPPTNKIYKVEQLMGGVSSFRKEVFEKISFSTYFEGYGLYEDADFTLRLSKIGDLYVNTSAQLEHYHDSEGRPNQYEYGKMVVRNGWYVWRVKYPNPSLKNIIKWHFITFLLLFIRGLNCINTNKKKEAFTEFLGRLVGWHSLFFRKPK